MHSTNVMIISLTEVFSSLCLNYFQYNTKLLKNGFLSEHIEWLLLHIVLKNQSIIAHRLNWIKRPKYQSAKINNFNCIVKCWVCTYRVGYSSLIAETGIPAAGRLTTSFEAD